MKQWIDRPHLSKNRILDKMTAELSKYMSEFEIDRIVDFMYTIDNSKFDINYTVDDAASQLRIILGSERYEEIKAQWALKNQQLITSGVSKWIRLSDGTIWDGLDPHDRIEDYKMVLM
jgi:hypothetical protein